jgi:hypothetical protein
MSRRALIATIFVAALLAIQTPPGWGWDEHPDPLPEQPGEVDPDGLEGLLAGGIQPSAEQIDSPVTGADLFVRSFFLLARVIGL